MANQLARLQDIARLGPIEPECSRQSFPVFMHYIMNAFERVASSLEQSFLPTSTQHNKQENAIQVEEEGMLSTMHPLQYKKEATFNIENSQFRMPDNSVILGSQSKNILDDIGDKEDLSKWEDYFNRLN